MKKSQKDTDQRRFIYRIVRSVFLASTFVLFSLLLGMLGYHHFGKMDWIDAYVNAAMILSGMGPINPPTTEASKLFEGTYALFSGIIFLISVGLILAPLFHHFFHKLHLDEDQKK